MIRAGPVSPLPDQSGYVAWFPTGSIGELTDFAAMVVAADRAGLLAKHRHDSRGLESRRRRCSSHWPSCSPPSLASSSRAPSAGVRGERARDRGSAHRLAVRPGPLSFASAAVMGLAGAYAVQRGLDAVPSIARRVALGGMAALALLLLVFNMRTRVDAEAWRAHVRIRPHARGHVNWVASEHQRPTIASWCRGAARSISAADRRTSIPNPEEATFGPSVFDAPRIDFSQRGCSRTPSTSSSSGTARRGGPNAWLRGMGGTLSRACSPRSAHSVPSVTSRSAFLPRASRPAVPRALRTSAARSARPENNNAP